MVEAETEEECKKYVDSVVEVIKCELPISFTSKEKKIKKSLKNPVFLQLFHAEIWDLGAKAWQKAVKISSF